MSIASTITLKQLSGYFHMPINSVAKELGVCATVLKKVCRNLGIPRWPHRKIKSIDKAIERLKATVPKTSDEADRIHQEILSQQAKRQFLVEHPASLVQAKPKPPKSKGINKKPIVRRTRGRPKTNEEEKNKITTSVNKTKTIEKKKKLKRTPSHKMPSLRKSPFLMSELLRLASAKPETSPLTAGLNRKNIIPFVPIPVCAPSPNSQIRLVNMEKRIMGKSLSPMVGMSTGTSLLPSSLSSSLSNGTTNIPYIAPLIGLSGNPLLNNDKKKKGNDNTLPPLLSTTFVQKENTHSSRRSRNDVILEPPIPIIRNPLMKYTPN